MMKTVAFHTLGCKVNSYESEAMKQLFVNAGYQLVTFKDIADVYVINTCTVTNTGDSKSRQMIRRAIRKNSAAVICVTGCYAQVAPDEIIKIEGVDVIIGTQYRNQIVELVEDALCSKQTIDKVEPLINKIEFEDLKVDVFTENTRAFLKIQDGCNQYCTYCIIPYARGNVRSRNKNDVIEQAQNLVNNGFVEIVLTGIHTAGYGVDFENYSFSDLLEDLVTKVVGLKRLRISSIEFSQINDKIIHLIQTNPIIVDHLHIPLQAGSNEILKRMNRKYTTEEYKDKIAFIRSKLPNIAITTDVIVGFPGETDELFNKAYNFIKEMQFSTLHVFPYSRRKNTPAASMNDQIDESIKSTRVKQLIELSSKLQDSYHQKQLHKVVSVLVEEKKLGYCIGHTTNFLKVKFKSERNLVGDIVNIELIQSKNGILYGQE